MKPTYICYVTLLVLSLTCFEFSYWDTTVKIFVPITDVKQEVEISRQLLPLYFVIPDDPPIIIAHEDADESVPLQQSERLIEKLRELNVTCELLIKKSGGHTWPDEEAE